MPPSSIPKPPRHKRRGTIYRAPLRSKPHHHCRLKSRRKKPARNDANRLIDDEMAMTYHLQLKTYFFAAAAFALSASAVNPAASFTAISASTLRPGSTPAASRPETGG